MAQVKLEFMFSRCARIILMLDEGKYDRTQMATALGVSVPTVARDLALFKEKFRVSIGFRVDPAGKSRMRGRTGSLFIADWGLVKREKTLRLCRAFLRANPDKKDPDAADLFKLLCCRSEEDLPNLATPAKAQLVNLE